MDPSGHKLVAAVESGCLLAAPWFVQPVQEVDLSEQVRVTQCILFQIVDQLSASSFYSSFPVLVGLLCFLSEKQLLGGHMTRQTAALQGKCLSPHSANQ